MAARTRQKGVSQMIIHVTNATAGQVDGCLAALAHSALEENYFQDPVKTRAMLSQAIDKGEIKLACTETGAVAGFVWYMPEGMFGSFPYLHVLAVAKAYRNRGIGTQLIQYFEEHASRYSSTQYFLTVDDFNPSARRLYERLGYRCVGVIPDLYQKGGRSELMVKAIQR